MHERARAGLEAKAVQIQAEMAHLSRPMQEQGNISFGKRVGDGTAMAVDRHSAVSAHDNLADILAQVRTALVAIEQGSYGVCSVCGEPIPDARLEARPWAMTCVRHA